MKTRAELDAELKAEKRVAERWLKKHEEKLPPADIRDGRVVDAGGDNGARRERAIVIFGGPNWEIGVSDKTVPTRGEGGKRRRDHAKVSSENSLNRMWDPLIGETPKFDLERYVKQQRVEAAEAELLPRQRLLLEDHFLQGLTSLELRQGTETRQAVEGRIKRAVSAARKAWELHKDDEVAPPSNEELSEFLKLNPSFNNVDELLVLELRAPAYLPPEAPGQP